MTQKFNPKQYQGKKRVYVKVPLSPNISRLYIWDDGAHEYLAPTRGKNYIASRRRQGEKRVKQFFRSVEEARTWQKFVVQPENPFDPKKVVNKTPLFAKILDDWRLRCLRGKAPGTVLQYERLLGFHFGMFMDKHIDEITPTMIDRWLDELTDPTGWRLQNPNRKGFDHELTLLGTILRYYANYSDQYGDPDYVVPLRDRHVDRVYDVKPGKGVGKKKDIPEKEFWFWRVELAKGKYAPIMPALATVQYYEALRISEAAGVWWEDVCFDWDCPENSYILIRRHLYWPRKKGHKSRLLPGFKNSKHFPDEIKVLPMYPEVFEALKRLYIPGAKGFVFQMDGEFLEYRWIQHCYDHAFERAGLPYSATHVMRHGGSSDLLNNSHGDATLAQQQLGVTNLKTAMTYAKRGERALMDYSKERWDEWRRKQNTQTSAEQK